MLVFIASITSSDNSIFLYVQSMSYENKIEIVAQLLLELSCYNH